MTDEIENELRSAIALLRTAIDTLDDIRGKLAPAAAGSQPDRRLNVPWLSQLGPNASYAPGDCGAACLAMLISFAGRRVTVDEVSKASGKSAGYTLMSFQELINAAARFDISLAHEASGLADICADIDAGRPVIALVNYKSLPHYNRYSAAYNAGHYLLVVGYDADCILYHDPFWPLDSRGAFRALTREDFSRAYTTIAPGNTRAPHALRVTA